MNVHGIRTTRSIPSCRPSQPNRVDELRHGAGPLLKSHPSPGAAKGQSEVRAGLSGRGAGVAALEWLVTAKRRRGCWGL